MHVLLLSMFWLSYSPHVLVTGPQPVHPGECPTGFVQHSCSHNHPHNDARHQGGIGWSVSIRQEDGRSRYPEALQVHSSLSTVGSSCNRRGELQYRWIPLKFVKCCYTSQYSRLKTECKCWDGMIWYYTKFSVLNHCEHWHYSEHRVPWYNLICKPIKF